MVRLIKTMDIFMDKLQELLKIMGSSICNISNNLYNLKNIRMTMIKFMRRMKKIKIMSSWLKSKWKNWLNCSNKEKWRNRTISKMLISKNSTSRRNKMKMVSYRRKKRSTRENMKVKGKSLMGKEKRRLSCKDRVKSIWRAMTKGKMMTRIMKSSIRMEREREKEKKRVKWWMKRNIIDSWLSNNNSKWMKIRKMICMKKINDYSY